MSVKITTSTDLKADIKTPTETLKERLNIGEGEESQFDLFNEDVVNEETVVEDSFVLKEDPSKTEEAGVDTEENIIGGEQEPVRAFDAAGRPLTADQQMKEDQYIEPIVSKLAKLKKFKDSEKYDPRILPNYIVTAVNNMRARALRSSQIFSGLGLMMTGGVRFRPQDWQKFQNVNAERKQQNLPPLTINQFKEQNPGILQERGDHGFINVDNEGNILEPNVPITRGSKVNLTPQAAMYHTQLLDAAKIDDDGKLIVDPDMPYIMSLAMEQFLIDEMFAAQKDADAEGITPTQLLQQKLNGEVDNTVLFDQSPKNVILEEAKGIERKGDLPTVKKTEMSEKLGRGFYQEWKRFQAQKKGLPQDFYVRDYEEMNSDVFVLLGDMISKLYSRANANLFKEIPEKVNRQTVFQVTPEGILQFSRLRQGIPGLFAQPEIEPDPVSSETGHKVTEQAVLTRDMTSKIGSLTDLPDTKKGKDLIDEAMMNMNKVSYVNDPRREKLALWASLLAFNGHDAPVLNIEDPASFMAREFQIGQDRLATLHQERELLKLKAELAAEDGLIDKAEDLMAQYEAYDPIAILREQQEKFLNVSNAIQKYSGRPNHLTFAVQALTGRIHAQQTLYNPQAHKLMRFVVGSGKVYQFTPNGKSKVEENWKEIMSAFFYEARFKEEKRTARLPHERINIFNNNIDSAKYKQYVSWGNLLLNNLENFDTNGAKQHLKQLHAYAKAMPSPKYKEEEKKIKDSIKQNFNNNFLAQDKELMKFLSGHEEEVIVYMDYLMDLAKWDQAKNTGGIHKSSIIVEIDGKTHGPATMAMALGSVAIAKRAGVLIPDTTLAGDLFDYKDLRFAMADSMLDRFNLLLDSLDIPVNQQLSYKEILKKAIEDTANFLKKSPMTYGYGQELESLKEYVAITVKSSKVAKDIGAKVAESKLKQAKVIEFLHGMLVDSIYQTFDPETIQINQVLKSNAQLAILKDQPIKFVNSLGFTSWISGKESSLDERKTAQYTFAEPTLTKYPQGKLNIWHGTGETANLSNLSQRPFTGEGGRVYQSVEHAYQSHKSGTFDQETYSKPWKDGSKFVGKKAKTEGNYNIRLMEKIMRQSFAQNPEAFNKLLETKGYELTHTQDKGVWKNKFPEILMKIRDEQGGEATTGLVPGTKKSQVEVMLYRSVPAAAAMVEKGGKIQVGRETAGGLLATITQSKDGNMVARVFTNSWKKIIKEVESMLPADQRSAKETTPFILPIFDAFVTDLGSFNAVRAEANRHHYNSLIESNDTEQVLEWGNKEIEKLSIKEADDNTPVEMKQVGENLSFYNGWKDLGIEHRGLRHLFPPLEERAMVDGEIKMSSASKPLVSLLKRVLDVTTSEVPGKKGKPVSVKDFEKYKRSLAKEMALRIEDEINANGINLAPLNRSGIEPTVQLTKGDLKKVMQIIIGPKGLNLKARNDKALVDLKRRRQIIIEELRKQGVSMNVDIAN